MPKKLVIDSKFQNATSRYLACECSVTDLAKEFAISKATVLKWMDILGVKRHPPGVMISKKHTGKPSGGKGAKRSPETIARMKAAFVGRKPATLGFKFSEISKAKMHDSAIVRAIREGKNLKGPDGKYPRKPRPAKPPKAVVVREPKPKRELMDPSVRKARDAARQKCKNMVRRVLTMARVRKDRKTEELLGYTKDDLRAHIESQFRDGMSWSVRESFHIDHIKPIAQFFREGVSDPSVINALENLQVLTPDENRRKSDLYMGFSEKFIGGQQSFAGTRVYA